MNGFLSFIIYAVLGGIAGSVFLMVASILEVIFLFGLFGVLSGFNGSLTERVESAPKRFVFCLVTKNVITGTLNALMIFTITSEFLQRTGANLWLYIGLSIFWSLLIHGYTNSYHLMYFSTSTITLVLFWYGFGLLSMLFVAPLTLLLGIAYYFGRTSVILESELQETIL
jgi:hypothetical protein